MKKPLVSIVICTQDRAKVLKDYVLRSILKLDYPDFEVVLVDDASKDNTQEIVDGFKDKIKRLTVVKNKKARGLCYARNLGMRYSKGEIIAFTDDDCYVSKNWLKELVKPYLDDKEVMVVGGRSYVRNTDKIYNEDKEIWGCNMSFRRKVFKKFLFDDHVYFNRCSWHDETELINRIKEKNWRTIYAKEAIVRHFSKSSQYRKNFELGEMLNYIYMYSKNIGLIRYYWIIFNLALFGKDKELVSTVIHFKLNLLLGLYSPKRQKMTKSLKMANTLLVEIPFKAKIRGLLDDIRYHFN